MSKFDSKVWLHDALIHSGLCQADLARLLSADTGAAWPPQKVNKLLLGQRRMTAEEMVSLAGLTGFPIPVPKSKVRVIVTRHSTERVMVARARRLEAEASLPLVFQLGLSLSRLARRFVKAA